MSGDKQGGFVQLPLCLLASNWALTTVMVRALEYSAARLATAWEEKAEFAGESEEMRYARAARTVGFKFDDRTADDLRHKIETGFDSVNREVDRHERAYGAAKTFVRMPTPYAIEICRGQWKDAEARVYCALASIIGVQKPYARAGWNVIAMRAAGFVKAPPPSCPLLTRPQVEYQLRRLQERSLFACYTLKRGVRYWSFPEKCSLENMARYVLQKHLARKRQLGESGAELTARITAELQKGNCAG